jgi:hypothetical protein
MSTEDGMPAPDGAEDYVAGEKAPLSESTSQVEAEQKSSGFWSRFKDGVRAFLKKRKEYVLGLPDKMDESYRELLQRNDDYHRGQLDSYGRWYRESQKLNDEFERRSGGWEPTPEETGGPRSNPSAEPGVESSGESNQSGSNWMGWRAELQNFFRWSPEPIPGDEWRAKSERLNDDYHRGMADWYDHASREGKKLQSETERDTYPSGPADPRGYTEYLESQVGQKKEKTDPNEYPSGPADPRGYTEYLESEKRKAAGTEEGKDGSTQD